MTNVAIRWVVQLRQPCGQQACDGGTRLTVETEYKVPVPVLGRMAEALIVKMNEQEGELVLANLKARMEA